MMPRPALNVKENMLATIVNNAFQAVILMNISQPELAKNVL